MHYIILAVSPILIYAAVAVVVGGVIAAISVWITAAKYRKEIAAERRAVMDQGKVAIDSSKSNGQKADKLIQATDKIHELTNSTNSNLQKALEVMTEKVIGLENMIAQLQKEKLLTANAQAVSDLKSGVRESGSHKTLRSIDENTEETAKNTASTEASMEEMKDKGKKK